MISSVSALLCVPFHVTCVFIISNFMSCWGIIFCEIITKPLSMIYHDTVTHENVILSQFEQEENRKMNPQFCHLYLCFAIAIFLIANKSI